MHLVGLVNPNVSWMFWAVEELMSDSLPLLSGIDLIGRSLKSMSLAPLELLVGCYGSLANFLCKQNT